MEDNKEEEYVDFTKPTIPKEEPKPIEPIEVPKVIPQPISKPIIKPVQIPQVIPEPVPEPIVEPEPIPEPVEEKVIEVTPIEKPSEVKLKVKKMSVIPRLLIIGCLIIAVGSLVFSSYIYYEFNVIKDQKIIYDADWNCIAEKCSEYWTQENFVQEHCSTNADGNSTCEIEYEGQIITLPIEQVTIQPDTMCKESSCAVEIPIRRNE